MFDRKSLLGLVLSVSATAAPTLKTDTAIYHLETGTLQYAFTFTNPTDSVVFLDCQVPPYASLAGGVLTLTFDRNALQAAWASAAAVPVAADSAASAADASGVSGAPGAPAASPSAGGGGHGVSNSGTGRTPAAARSPLGVLAGGPVDGSAVNPDDFPPQRVGARQTFQGQRRLDRVLGDWSARPVFAKVQLRMAVLPERTEGDGAPFVAERGVRVAAGVKGVVRKGKAPAPVKAKKFRVGTDAP
jgi:hypothetical protein